MRVIRIQWFILALTLFLAGAPFLNAQYVSRRCFACEKPIDAGFYLAPDKVTLQKQELCEECIHWPDNCSICGLPVRKNFIKVSDGRFICGRDAQTAVLDDDAAADICAGVKDSLDRLFSRFVTFPDKNVDVTLMDRVNLLALKSPGHDIACPMTLGYLRPGTNQGQIRYQMNLMSGLSRHEFEATCAHEYTHAWVLENVPPARRKTLGPDAHEGFCELVAYLLMESKGHEMQQKAILLNNYTRGQIDLFLNVNHQYGFNDIVDWMKYGEDTELNPTALHRIRQVKMPATTEPVFSFYPRPPTTSVPDTLTLRGVSGGKTPLALINDQTLAVGETGKVRVGTSNVMVRCLAIGTNSVRIQLLSSGKEQELQLPVR